MKRVLLRGFFWLLLTMTPVVAQSPKPSPPKAVPQAPTSSGSGIESNKNCWFPFPKGVTGVCGQGPNGNGTHRGSYAWDFVLPEGTPILAPAAGRVIHLVDDHKVVGIRPAGTSPEEVSRYQKLSMENANQIAIDHGDGTYSWYWHHQAGTARVRPGSIVAAGEPIAAVGMSGTYVAHICFSMKSIEKSSWDVRFQVGVDTNVVVTTGQECLSQTMLMRETSSSFLDSMVKGVEFSANGVLLNATKQPLFYLPAERELVYQGKVSEPAVAVGFYLWKPGQQSEFIKTIAPDASGHFQLKVWIPKSSRGHRFYTIAVKKPNGEVKSPVNSLIWIY